MADVQLIQQAVSILSKCGGSSWRKQGSVLPLYKGWIMPMVLQPNQTIVFTKEITGETIWNLRAISSDQGSNSVTGVRIQIQLPNGRFLFGGNGIDAGQFAWVGSYRYSMDPDLDCEPGSKIQVTLSDTVGLGAAVAINLFFEGAYHYYFTGGGPLDWQSALASEAPRYQGIVNENILAPSFIAGYGLETPEGFEDDDFTYASQLQTFTLGGSTTASLKIPIDAGLNFHCRRLLFDLTPSAGVTAGSVLGRIRTGDGYALNETFIDLARYLNGAEFAHDWVITQGDAVFIDLALVDTGGSGTIGFQAYLEGVRRKKL